MMSFSPCVEWNREYIEAHPNSYLAQCKNIIHANDPERFVDTCCEITVAAILWKLGISCLETRGNISITDITEPIFIINFDDGEHVLIVVNGVVYQSYYYKYTVRESPLTPQLMEAINDPCKGWSYITGLNETLDYTPLVQYQIPKK
jgi:hypothetical protein